MREWSRREFLRFLGLSASGLLLGAALSGCGARPQQASTQARSSAAKPLKTGYLPITDASPLLIAHAKGFYEAEGVEAERPYLFRGWSQIVEAFVAGQVDVIHVLMPTAVWMRFAQEVPVRIVAWNHTDGSAFTVHPGIDRVLDLAGQTVAIPYWYSIHNVVLQQLLRHHGLRPAEHTGERLAADEVRLVVMAPSDMPAALANGSIAGYIVAEPFNAAAEVMEVGKILRFTGDVWLRHACCVVVMKEDDLERRPAWAQSVINALVKAQLWMRENREEAARLLSAEGYLPQPLAAIERALTHYDHEHYGPSGAIRHPEWGSARIDFVPYPYPSYTEALVRFLQDTYVEGERAFLTRLDPKEAHGRLVDDTFVRKALDQVGGLAAFGLPNEWTRTEVISL
jgi:ABC-type nitrate/sulfonate/bicarbonate transport systems, periplasmic components